jgi:hypothetical protein
LETSDVRNENLLFFYFDLSEIKFPCDEQGLRYSFPGYQVQLRRISGQLNVFFLLEKINLVKSQK